MRRKIKYTFTRKEETEGGFFFGVCRCSPDTVSVSASLFPGRESGKLDRSAWSDVAVLFSVWLDRNEEL